MRKGVLIGAGNPCSKETSVSSPMRRMICRAPLFITSRCKMLRPSGWHTLHKAKIEPTSYSARVRGSFVPDVSGVYRVGLFFAGLWRVYIDGQRITDT